ncbi:MAG TPA: NAD(P)H-dependent oxidoreductase [Anaeromyxobacter sp.]
MEGPLRMGVILASVRDGRRGEPFARWIHALAAEREGLFVELLDLREWALPAYARKDTPNVAEKAYAPDSLEGRWRAKIDSQDAFVVVTPEYNHSFPGQLKNALDAVYAPWSHKPIAFVSYGGFASGARAAEHLRLVAIELRMAPIRDEVNVRLVGYAADERGFPADPLYAKKAKAMLDDLVWWARVLREGREAHRR